MRNPENPENHKGLFFKPVFHLVGKHRNRYISDAYDPSKLNQDNINHLNWFKASKEIKAVIKHLLIKNNQYSAEFYKTFKECRILTRLEIEMLYNTAIPLLDTCLVDFTFYHRDTYTMGFVLSQPIYLLIDEWVRKNVV